MIIPPPCTFIFFVVFCINISFQLPNIIRIGAIFGEDEIEQETAFRFAIEKINDEANILPGATLVAQVERVNLGDTYRIEKKVCSLGNSGIIGIVGPTSEISTMHVRSVCDALEIPHLEVHWNMEPKLESLTVNLHPRPEILVRAYVDIAKGLGWDDFAVVFDLNEKMSLYQPLLMEAREKNWKLKIYQTQDIPFRETFYKVKEDGKKNIIMDIRHANVIECLKHAQQVGVLTDQQNFIIGSLDMVTEDLTDFMFSGANIFSFRMIEDTANPELATLLNDWSYISDKMQGKVSIPAPKYLKTESALIYDSVKLLATALGGLDRSQSVEIGPVSCVDEIAWNYGSSLVNYMRPIMFRGLSGLVAFDEFGRRASFTLSILILDKNGISKIGDWNPRSGLNITSSWLDSYSDFAITQRPWIVTTVETEPFTMKRISSHAPKGNAQYEGYAVDLIDELSLLLNFKYEIRLCKDRKYGNEQEDGTWNGMIGELMKDEADIAIVDLTITRLRERVVDFTLPFMTTGVSVLFTTPKKAESSLFGFLAPFTISVWMYLVIATVITSIVFFIVGRLTPYEWDNPFPCKEDLPILVNECSVKNSFWFTVGSLMQQGSDLAPKSMSTRIIGGVWYFFTLIIVSSYTANLAAFLTVEVSNYPFNNVEELASQTKIGYGCGASGSTRTSFRDSPNPTLKRLSVFMEKNPGMFVRNNNEGQDRVLRGNYAFFMEGAAIEYSVERICNFTQIGGLLDSKGYGIATKKDSPIRHALSRGILKLQEKGTLHILYERWWKQKRGGGSCQAREGGGAAPMAIGNVGGVFVVLSLGALLSLIMAVGEFIYKNQRAAPDTKSAIQDMSADLAFMFRLQEYTKPNRRRKSTTSLAGSSTHDKKKNSGPHPAFYKSTNSNSS